MAIYLVQHGAAKAEAEDPQRGVTDEGRRTVERMGEYLTKCGVALDRIEHSDKARARQTAEILAARLHPAHGTAQVPGLAPNDDVEPTCARLNQETSTVMLVGHFAALEPARLALVWTSSRPHARAVPDGWRREAREGRRRPVDTFMDGHPRPAFPLGALQNPPRPPMIGLFLVPFSELRHFPLDFSAVQDHNLRESPLRRAVPTEGAGNAHSLRRPGHKTKKPS